MPPNGGGAGNGRGRRRAEGERWHAHCLHKLCIAGCRCRQFYCRESRAASARHYLVLMSEHNPQAALEPRFRSSRCQPEKSSVRSLAWKVERLNMSLESERGGLSRRITRRQFAAASSVLLFADWVSGAEEVPKIPPAGPAIAPHRAGDVLNVRDFEPLARAALPPAHFGYLATGIDDDRTLRRNEQAFGDYEIRARRFVDLSNRLLKNRPTEHP